MAIYQGHNEDSSGNILLSIGNGMTATVETGTKASQAYTKGAYLFFNNRLCKAASAIASGATLTIGGNLTQTSLGAEITSHLRSSDGKEFYFDVKDGNYGYYPSASKTASEFVPFGGTSVLEAYTYDITNARCTAIKTDGSVYYNPSSYNKAFSGSVITVTGGNNTDNDLTIKANVACKIIGGYMIYPYTSNVSLSGDYNAGATIFSPVSRSPQLSIIAIKK